MSDIDNEESSPGISLNDILFMLFRHKGTVILCTALGLVGAALVYFLMPPAYESQAKLLVPYVVERSAIDSVDSQVKMATDNLINSEVEILTSRDLVLQIVDGITVERLLPGSAGKATVADAVHSIQVSLSVTPLKGSNIILLSYKNADPELARRVLEELVTHYRSKHLEVHRSLGTFDFVTQQTDQIRMRLSETEDSLKRLKAKEGIISLAETSTTLNTELARTQDQLRAAETELEEQRARVKELERWAGDTDPGNDSSPQPTRDIVQQYQVLVTRLGKLRQAEFDLLAKYTPESPMAQRMRAQIEGVEGQRRTIEKKYPSLAVAAPSSSSSAPTEQGTDLVGERTRFASYEAKVTWLKSRLENIKQSILRFSEVAPQIAQLERKREMEESNYRYYEASLEKARIDEALDPAKLPNISVVERPSIAVKAVSSTKKKLVLGLAGGGLGLGIAIALLMELIVDRSVKRPLEFEAQLRVPMLCWIPMIGRNGSALPQSRHGEGERKLALPNGSDAVAAPWEPGHFIRSFSKEIRDRLILYFEIKRTTHKPKLIAVTGCSENAGTSTIAGGIAAALSEMSDGKVLLVDMHDAAADLHPLFEGQPIFSLSDALESTSAMCAAAENLYLATASLQLDEGESIAPKTFYNMVPRFHSSDFDYVVFDMPPMDQSTSTLALARFMDKVLMVVESEKVSRDTVQRSYSELKFANPNVSAVLNKTRSYTPRWLGVEC